MKIESKLRKCATEGCEALVAGAALCVPCELRIAELERLAALDDLRREPGAEVIALRQKLERIVLEEERRRIARAVRWEGRRRRMAAWVRRWGFAICVAWIGACCLYLGLVFGAAFLDWLQLGTGPGIKPPFPSIPAR